MNLYTQQAEIFVAQFRALKDTDLPEATRLFEKANRAHDVAKENGDVTSIVPQFYGSRDESDFPDLESYEAYVDYGKAFSMQQKYDEDSVYALRWTWGRAVAKADLAFVPAENVARFDLNNDIILFTVVGGAEGKDDYVLYARSNGSILPPGSVVLGVYEPEEGLLILGRHEDTHGLAPSYRAAVIAMKKACLDGILPPEPRNGVTTVRRVRSPAQHAERKALLDGVPLSKSPMAQALGRVLRQTVEPVVKDLGVPAGYDTQCPFCKSSKGVSFQEDFGKDWPRCNNCGAC